MRNQVERYERPSWDIPVFINEFRTEEESTEMKRDTIFEAVAVYRCTDDERSAGGRDRPVSFLDEGVPVRTLILCAEDQDRALAAASRQLNTAIATDEIERVEVTLRPFRG